MYTELNIYAVDELAVTSSLVKWRQPCLKTCETFFTLTFCSWVMYHDSYCMTQTVWIRWLFHKRNVSYLCRTTAERLSHFWWNSRRYQKNLRCLTYIIFADYDFKTDKNFGSVKLLETNKISKFHCLETLPHNTLTMKHATVTASAAIS